jgi:4-hydroxy-tetrahydrodipicolinate synthase
MVMDAAGRRFTGLFIPHVTPFSESGALDLQSLERLAQYLTRQKGVAGLVSCARIGEGPVLNGDEKRKVYQIAGKLAHQAGLLHIATIAPQSTDEAIGLMRDLERLPVDAVMIFPPLLFAWGKVEGDLKVRFFEDLSRSSDLPMVLFQVPVSSYWYDAETICRIAQLGTIVALKEASFNINLFTETLRQLKQKRCEINVLTGNDRFVAQSYLLGAKGALIGVSNLATEKWASIDLAARAGNYTKALAVQEELEEFKELIFSEPIVEAVARIKIILQESGLIRSAVVRRPQLGVNPEERKKLIRSYMEITEGKPASGRKISGLQGLKAGRR